jgi:hypothetical protein
MARIRMMGIQILHINVAEKNAATLRTYDGGPRRVPPDLTISFFQFDHLPKHAKGPHVDPKSSRIFEGKLWATFSATSARGVLA